MLAFNLIPEESDSHQDDSGVFAISSSSSPGRGAPRSHRQSLTKALRQFSEELQSLSSPHSQDNRDVFEKGLKNKKFGSPNMKSHIFDRMQGKLGKGGVCVEYADQGTGDFRTPSFTIADNFNGSTISPLKYRKHKIYRGKLPMPDCMPAVRCHSEFEASTLVITLVDAASGLEVDLVYGKRFRFIVIFLISFLLAVVMHEFDVITRRATFRNADQRSVFKPSAPTPDCSPREEEFGKGAKAVPFFEAIGEGRSGDADSLFANSKVIQKASSFTIDFDRPSSAFYLVQTSGR